MSALDNLMIHRDSHRPPKSLHDCDINSYSRHSTECAGNHRRVKSLIRKIRRALKAKKIQLPDYFVGIGASGLGVASVLSYEFNVPFIHIRKGRIGRFAEEDNDEPGGYNWNLDRVGYPNITPSIMRERNWYEIKDKIERLGFIASPYYGKTFWFVDDCIDTGHTYDQALHMCTFERGMVCTGVALTWFSSVGKVSLKKRAHLKSDAPLNIFKMDSRYAYG